MGQLGRECKPRAEWEQLIVEHPDLNDLQPGKVYPQDFVDKLQLSAAERTKVFKSLVAMGMGEDLSKEEGTSVWHAVLRPFLYVDSPAWRIPRRWTRHISK